MPRRIAMSFQMRVIYLRRYAANWLLPSSGEPEFRLRIIKKRIFTRVEMIAALRKQRRHPMSIFAIDRPGNPQKSIAIVGGVNGDD